MSKIREATSKVNVAVGHLQSMKKYGARKESIESTMELLNEAVEILNELEVEEWKQKAAKTESSK